MRCRFALDLFRDSCLTASLFSIWILTNEMHPFFLIDVYRSAWQPLKENKPNESDITWNEIKMIVRVAHRESFLYSIRNQMLFYFGITSNYNSRVQLQHFSMSVWRILCALNFNWLNVMLFDLCRHIACRHLALQLPIVGHKNKNSYRNMPMAKKEIVIFVIVSKWMAAVALQYHMPSHRITSVNRLSISFIHFECVIKI